MKDPVCIERVSNEMGELNVPLDGLWSAAVRIAANMRRRLQALITFTPEADILLPKVKVC